MKINDRSQLLTAASLILCDNGRLCTILSYSLASCELPGMEVRFISSIPLSFKRPCCTLQYIHAFRTYTLVRKKGLTLIRFRTLCPSKISVQSYIVDSARSDA